jgi:hypothetical protein
VSRHLWIGGTLLVLTIALGAGLWLRQGHEVPFAVPITERSVDPQKDAVVARVKQEQADAHAEQPAEPFPAPELEKLE